MKNEKKMAIICSTDYVSYPMGGMMSFILDTLPYLKDDFDITLWGVTTEENPTNSIVVNNESYPFKSFSEVKTKNKIVPNLIRVSYNIWKMRKEILSDNYDILYIHGIPLSFPFFKNKDVKVVNHIHGLTNPFAMTANKMARNPFSIGLYEKYRDWVVKMSDMILLASDKQGHKQFSSKYPQEENKIKYVPNFADQSIFSSIKQADARNKLGIEKDKTVFVNTGRVSLQKDPILLVQSFIYFIKELGGNAKLIIIGEGELSDTVEKMASEAGLENKITITGKIDRQTINFWLNAADLYVYTSHANGFPISLAESASCGLPIVTTDVTGVHDLVINDLTGYLVQNRNPEDIAKAIEVVLMRKQEFGKNILETSQDFSPDIVTRNIKQMLLSL